MTTPRVLVIGASGQLGGAITEAFAGWDVTPHTSASLNITDAGAVHHAVAVAQPDVIINCAAFNDVDGAESRPADAFAVNSFALRSLARAAEDHRARLVHYSTDFVFDGRTSSPYAETASPAPRSVYAASKLVGEWFALEAPDALVLRVESLFGTRLGWTGRRGTLDHMLARIEQGAPVQVFTDRTVSPSYTVDVAAATRHLIDASAAGGLYHCVNSGAATWEQVAREIARLLDVPPLLELRTMDQVPMKAQRPRFCALSNDKLAAAGYRMPSWQDALSRWLVSRGALSGIN